MAFGKNSKGIAQLQKKDKEKSQISKRDITQLQKKLKDKLSKQLKDITTNYNKFLANDKKARDRFEKSYEDTKKLQERVMNRLIKAVDDKRKEIFNQKNSEKKMYLGEIEAKLDEMKDFTSEIRPTIKAIHKKYKSNVIPRLDELREKIKTHITEKNENIRKIYDQINQSLKKLSKNPSQKNNYKELYNMVETFPDYGTDIKQSYNQGNIYVTMNISKFINTENKSTTYNTPLPSNSSNPTKRNIETACNETTKAINNLKTLQQTPSNSPTMPSFLTSYLGTIKDPLLKLTFIFGAEKALIIRTTQYMHDAQRELKEYEQTASKLHITAKDVVKKIGIGFLKMIPAIIGMATGLGSTLAVLTDLVESLGWFLNAVAYAASDASGLFGEQKTELITSDIDDMSKTMLDVAEIDSEQSTNNSL